MMTKLTTLFFLLFSTVSPKSLLLLNSTMDMEEGNSNVNPEVLIKSITPAAIKYCSFAAKLNPLPIEPKLPISEEPLPLAASTEPAIPMEDTTPRTRYICTGYVMPTCTPVSDTKNQDPFIYVLNLATASVICFIILACFAASCWANYCYNKGDLPNQCKNCSKKTAFREIVNDEYIEPNNNTKDC